MMPPFIPLKVASCYSLLESMLRPSDIVRLCAKHKLPAFAVTDRGNLYGAMEISLAAIAQGIQPILACSLCVKTDPDDHSLTHLSLYAQNETGWHNLMQLVSKAHKAHIVDKAPLPSISFQELAEKHEGLIALSGAREGKLYQLLLKKQRDQAEQWTLKLKELFGNRFYLEISRHSYEEESYVNPALMSLGARHHIPVAATHATFYEKEQSFEAHKVLRQVMKKDDVRRELGGNFRPSHFFASPAQMRTLFKDCPDALAQTVLIAQRCSFTLHRTHSALMPSLSQEEDALLRKKAQEGLSRRFAQNDIAKDKQKEYEARLTHELDVIIRMKFSGYFLILDDFIAWSLSHDVPVGPGRGSGAGSLVAWALRITDIDPIRFGLLFERFLNPDRADMPDMDIDFCRDRRDDVVAYVRKNYGEDRVSHVITFGALKARAAMRGVGRALNYPHKEVDALVSQFPLALDVTIESALKSDKVLAQKVKQDSMAQRIVTIAQQIEGLYSHASTHAAGIVIGDKPLHERIPISFDENDKNTLTQWAMKQITAAGLIKFDFLGLKTLTMLDHAKRMLKERNTDIDFTQLPLDDATTYDMLGKGESTGVFQLESGGMRSVLRSVKPDCFDDIIAIVALYRPGPMENIESFAKRKHGDETIRYLDERMKVILEATYGIPVYQEQVMQLAQSIADFSAADADHLRSAMSKKNTSEMEKLKTQFIQGASKKNISNAERIWELMEKFGGYGFNKSHAAAYALIAYQTAWLKANEPLVFYASSLSLDYDNQDKCALFCREARLDGIVIRPPHINHSDALFSVHHEDKEIYYALAAIRHVGKEAALQIAHERQKGGTFKSLADVMKRLEPKNLNKRLLESLIKAGALDGILPSRQWGIDNIATIIAHGHHYHARKNSSQMALFGDDTLDFNPPRNEQEWQDHEKLQHEFDMLGDFFSGHPLNAFKEQLQKDNIRSAHHYLNHARHGKEQNFKLVGMVTKINRRLFRSRGNKGAKKQGAFLTLSDWDGIYEVAAFSEIYEKYHPLLKEGALLQLNVRLTWFKDILRLSVESLKALEKIRTPQAENSNPHEVQIVIDGQEGLRHVQNITSQLQQGTTRIVLLLDDGSLPMKKLKLPHHYAVTAALLEQFKQGPGVRLMSPQFE